jgi:hypothetical protein
MKRWMRAPVRWIWVGWVLAAAGCEGAVGTEPTIAPIAASVAHNDRAAESGMIKCPFCAFCNEEGALFCEQCKSDLSSVEPPPRPPRPGMHRPHHVAGECAPRPPVIEDTGLAEGSEDTAALVETDVSTDADTGASEPAGDTGVSVDPGDTGGLLGDAARTCTCHGVVSTSCTRTGQLCYYFPPPDPSNPYAPPIALPDDCMCD